ncbi:ATRX [Lepeophtheirus salmonis]|uniref:ATRX n=1 Tax=Lepeophtheirus salmonis TaxID=72036 RepID=A0A7R8CGS1_LEPSM|nr:ATRX [Lepeophtheirus salmonis]CAF2812514.1 ATRX [Lepeophtheirus salmonis]
MDSVQRGSSSASPSSCSLNPSSLSDAEYFGSLGEDELSTLHGSSHSEYTSCFTCFTKFHITFLSRHPLLAVPVCNPCKQFYSSQTWKLYPEISSFERCRSCAKDSFKLILCKSTINPLGTVLSVTNPKSSLHKLNISPYSTIGGKKHDHKLYLDPITKSFTSSKEVQIQYKESLFWEYELWKKLSSEKSIENDNNKRDDDEISICSSTTPITSMTPYVKILYNDNENTKETQPVASKDGQVKIQYDTNENTNETQTGSSEDCQISIQIQNNPNKNTNETQPAETSKESQNSLNKNISDYTSNENSLIIHEIFKKELKISLKPVQESILKEIKEKGHFKISKLQKKKFDAEYAAISRLCNFKNISSHEKKEKEAPNIEEIELDDSDESDTGFNISDSHKISSNRTIFSSSDDDGDDDVMSLCSEIRKKRKHESLPQFYDHESGAKKDNNQNSYSSTDDDDDNEEKRQKKKRRIIELLSDDSDENNIVQDKSMPSGSSSSTSVSSDSYASDADSLTPCSSKKKGKRIKSAKKSSDTDEGTPNKGRKKLHKIIKDHKLSEMSKEAAEIERERRKRMEEKLKMYQKEFVDSVKSSEIIEDLILDFDPETKEKRVELDKELVKQLKPHQADGIKFMWNSVFESKDDVLACKYPGGAILAHCMGLGKTLQTIALIHTVLTNFPEHITKVLVICPVNTVKNWKDEFDKWCKDSLELDVYELSGDKGNDDRTDRLNYWLKGGGVLIIGYDMFRNLTTSASRKLNKRQKGIILRSLVDPGPDLVVCDEGHVLKNRNSALNKSINKIGTKRRIILTGTPLQNNLSEYFAMVNFVKPNLLGSYKEFKNRFVNPIQNGQHSDSTDDDVRVMKKRSFILSDLLKGCLQRLDYNVSCPISSTQI